MLGIDLSFRGPAACVIPHAWDMTLPGLPYQDGLFDVKDEYAYDRMDRIARTLVGFAQEQRATHGFIEGYAHGMAMMAHASVLRELGGIVKLRFWRDLEMKLVPVPEASARKLMLGKMPKRDKKVYVQVKVYAMGAPRRWTDNVIDSVVVANFGRHALGLPALSVGG